MSQRTKDAVEIWKGSDGPLFEPPIASPDGKRLATPLRGQRKIRLTVMNADGTGQTALAGDLDVRGTGAWSPDGLWIVIGGLDAKGPGLFKIAVEGGAPVRLTSSVATNPVWSPDGKQIVFDRIEEHSDIVLIEFPKSSPAP